MDDESTGGLLGIDLPVLGESTSDAVGVEQSEELFLIAHLGACRIPEGIPTATICLGEDLTNARRIIPPDSQFGSHALVPEFRKSFSAFHAEPMQEQILLIFVVLEESTSHLAESGAHGHAMKPDDVTKTGLDRFEEIADAEAVLLLLPREGDSGS